MRRLLIHTIIALTLGLGLTLALLWLLGGSTAPVTAAPGESPGEGPAERPLANGGITRYVAVTGTNTANDCTNSGNPCQTIQYAIDRPGDGDEIRVAGGTYTGVQVRGGLTQVVFISETVTIRGGYSVDFSAWDPETTPTTLDAEEQGRVVVVQATITATLEALRLTNGLIAGTSADGGGIYVQTGDVIISGCHIYSNTAQYGGGGFLAGQYLLLTGSWIYGNRADNLGGGLVIFGEPVTVTGNQIYSNTAAYGGGVSTYADGGVFEGNHVFANRADNQGGGLRVHSAPGATFASNHIYSNTAAIGGGICVRDSDGATLSGNHIYSNTSTALVDGGGGVCVASENVLLVGNAVFGNRAEGSGGGVSLYQSSHNVTLTGNEIYSNSAKVAGAGIHIRESQTATLTYNEVYSNSTDLGGSGGGGVYLWDADGATLTGNEIHHHTLPTGNGGGVLCSSSNDVTVASNWIHHNTTSTNGGGGFFDHCHRATLRGNDIAHNESTANVGGGLYVDYSDDVTLVGNRVYSNTAGSTGGIHFRYCDDATLINTIVADNQRGGLTGAAVGVDMQVSSARMLHTTIARNGGAQDAGMFVRGSSTVALTNTILVGHDEGIEVETGSSATLQATLWGTATWSNAQDWVGGGTIITGGINIWEDPGFLDPDSLDYHIGSNSGARDAGVDAGVSDDIDGDARPFGTAPDLGADEVQCHVRIGSTYYATLQDAVDDASQDDLIQVAGTCRGGGRFNTVAYVTETVTIRGGYSGDFFDWHPNSYPTTLDGLQQGSVIYINGDYTPTLEALRLTNGRSGNGGGIQVVDAHPVVSGCYIYNNTSTGMGGGIFFSNGDNARLMGNVVFSNAASSGIKLGGGVFLQGTDSATFENNVVVDNWVGSSGSGSGIYMNASSAQFWHTTIARNTGGNGTGIHVVSGAAALTNTIVASQTVGVSIASGGAALTATLWGDGAWDNGTDWSGPGTVITGTLNWWGDPFFVAPDDDDYHLGSGSAAFDKGLSTWVSQDIDGESRAVGPSPDLGADEAVPVLTLIKTGPSHSDPGADITYTLSITNSGVVTAYSVVLTDAVPSGAYFAGASNGGVESGGVVSWTVFNVPPGGGVITRTFVVTATEGISNTDYWATAQGMPSVAGSVAVRTDTDFWVYLPLVLRDY